MSVTALIRTRGSTVTIRRCTKTRNVPGDGSAVESWADAATGVKVLLEQITSEKAQRTFGREHTGTMLGFAVDGQDIREDDGIIVTAGSYSGARYFVRGALLRKQPPKHLLLGLEDTQETF